MFCPAGVAGTASRPRLAVMRPNSSKAAEFISSCSAFGSILDLELRVRPFRLSNLNCMPPCWLIRAIPSHLLVPVGVGAVTARDKGLAVCGVVAGLAHDDRVLARLEDARAVDVVLEGVVERRQVERRRPGCRRNLDLHDGPSVRTIAGQDDCRRPCPVHPCSSRSEATRAGKAAGASLYRMSVLPAYFEKSTMTSARSAGASSSECLSTLPTSKRVGSVIHVVGCGGTTSERAGSRPRSRSGSSSDQPG